MNRFPFLPVIATSEDLFGILLFVLIAFFIIRALHASRGSRRDRMRRPDPAEPDEAEMLRRLCDQLEKMEHRLNNLETILMDKNETKRP